MENQPTREEIDQFKRDVDILGLSHIKIAEKMGMHKSNFSNYFNETPKHAITGNFLKKFYEAWDEKLNEKRKESKSYPDTDPSPASEVSEEPSSYPAKSYRDDFIEFMQKSYTSLSNNFDKIADSNHRLVVSCEKLVESNRELVKAVLGGSRNDPPPDKPSSPKKPPKKPKL